MKYSDLNLVGQQFGRLTVIKDAGRKRKQILWECLCVCGNTKLVVSTSLRKGHTKSCGCLQKEWQQSKKTHGMSGTNLYLVWQAMINRCERPKTKNYADYGGRGIKVCDRWHSFENFYADMGERPNRSSIERIDNNGNYEPSNVRWANRVDQANNKRNNRLLTYNGQTKSISQWASELGITFHAIERRIKNGWSIEKALTFVPKNTKKPNARFTDDQINTIREQFFIKSSVELGKIYGVSKTSILNICKRKTYSDVL
jgi:hypothetical protein